MLGEQITVDLGSLAHEDGAYLVRLPREVDRAPVGKVCRGRTDARPDAGIRIFEYNGSMIHAKVLLVDDLWAVIGTTNLDNRSFEHNDEVNVAIRDEDVAQRLLADFRTDLRRSTEVTLDTWRARPFLEKLVGPVAWILERQQ